MKSLELEQIKLAFRLNILDEPNANRKNKGQDMFAWSKFKYRNLNKNVSLLL